MFLFLFLFKRTWSFSTTWMWNNFRSSWSYLCISPSGYPYKVWCSISFILIAYLLPKKLLGAVDGITCVLLIASFVLIILCWFFSDFKLSCFSDCRRNVLTLLLLTRECLMHFGELLRMKASEDSIRDLFRISSKLCLLQVLLTWSMRV